MSPPRNVRVVEVLGRSNLAAFVLFLAFTFVAFFADVELDPVSSGAPLLSSLSSPSIPSSSSSSPSPWSHVGVVGEFVFDPRSQEQVLECSRAEQVQRPGMAAELVGPIVADHLHRLLAVIHSCCMAVQPLLVTNETPSK